jgi:tetratricopeptide (TPR) repeat protein
MNTSHRYLAFISYSHRDAAEARWLHRALEGFKIPSTVRAAGAADGIPERLSPIFMDRAELSSSSDLSKAVIEALEASRSLVVICSPDAARSKWVDDEVRRFKALGRSANIFCLIVGGRASYPLTGDLPEDLCFPRALVHEVDGGGAIPAQRAPAPSAADIRPGGDGRRDAKLKIVAGLIGVPFDQLRRREDARRNKRFALAGTAATVAVGILTASLVMSVRARHEAERERARAEAESLRAAQTADFLKSLFVVADPSESRGTQITAREILDRGAERIDKALVDQPAVHAGLLTTLGEVYTSLGLYPRSIDLLSRARDTQARAGIPETDVLSTKVSLGDARYGRGEYDAAEKLYKEVTLRGEKSAQQPSPILSRGYFGLGEALTQREAFAEGDAAYRQALKIDQALHAGDHVDVARDISGLARSQFYQGNLEEGEKLFRRSLAMRQKLLGNDHPRVAEDLNALASIEYLRGDYPAAERDFSATLVLYQKIFGPEHSDTATVMNNVARLQLEQRKFSAAYDLLRASVDIDRKSKDPLHDDFAFSYDSLGLARMGAGEFAEAEHWFKLALDVEKKHKHRMLGPTLTNLADLRCRRRDYQAGLDVLADARPALGADYEDEAWRMALADSVAGACLLGLGRTAEAERLIRGSLPVIEKRWGSSRLFGHDALRRVAALDARRGSAPP